MLDQIRQGVTSDMENALVDESLTRLEMHAVTQSYLMLQILDKLESIDGSMITMVWPVAKFNPISEPVPNPIMNLLWNKGN